MLSLDLHATELISRRLNRSKSFFTEGPVQLLFESVATGCLAFEKLLDTHLAFQMWPTVTNNFVSSSMPANELGCLYILSCFPLSTYSSGFQNLRISEVMREDEGAAIWLPWCSAAVKKVFSTYLRVSLAGASQHLCLGTSDIFSFSTTNIFAIIP